MGHKLEGAAHLAHIADQMRAMANNGLHYGKDPYDIDRYERILKLAAELLSLTTTQSLAEIEPVFATDLGMRTPLVGVDTAVFDEVGRVLLIQRVDNHKWAMPGGACEVGDSPAQNAAREVWEETGYHVEITHLLGIFDNTDYHRNAKRHGYLMLFGGKVVGGAPTLSNETLDVQWVAQDAIPWDNLSPGHPQRLGHAVQWHTDPTTPAYFNP